MEATTSYAMTVSATRDKRGPCDSIIANQYALAVANPAAVAGTGEASSIRDPVKDASMADAGRACPPESRS